jgi:hypothetical protein
LISRRDNRISSRIKPVRMVSPSIATRFTHAMVQWPARHQALVSIGNPQSLKKQGYWKWGCFDAYISPSYTVYCTACALRTRQGSSLKDAWRDAQSQLRRASATEPTCWRLSLQETLQELSSEPNVIDTKVDASSMAYRICADFQSKYQVTMPSEQPKKYRYSECSRGHAKHSLHVLHG